MGVYQIDVNRAEVDWVNVNAFKFGILNGSSDTSAVNVFSIPPGIHNKIYD